MALPSEKLLQVTTEIAWTLQVLKECDAVATTPTPPDWDVDSIRMAFGQTRPYWDVDSISMVFGQTRVGLPFQAKFPHPGANSGPVETDGQVVLNFQYVVYTRPDDPIIRSSNLHDAILPASVRKGYVMTDEDRFCTYSGSTITFGRYNVADEIGALDHCMDILQALVTAARQ